MRTILFAMRVLAFCLIASGCAPKEVDHNAPVTGKTPCIALIMKSLANEFFSTMAEGARKHHNDNKKTYDLVVNGMKNETDFSEQVTLIEQMVARGVQSIVIAPADSKAIIPALKRARDAGVLVINIDNRLDPNVLIEVGLTIPFVGPDNWEGAKKAGEAVARMLTKGDAVAIVEGIPTAMNSQERCRGLRDAMNDARMNIVSSQSGQWEMEKANSIAAAMLSEYPSLKAILCANDSMALGVVAAVAASGRSADVKVTGFDNTSAVGEMIANGRIFATVDQHGDQLAVHGIETALSVLAGNSTPKDTTTAVDLVMRKDAR